MRSFGIAPHSAKYFVQLLLNPKDAQRWFALEREALKLDTELRNTHAVMTRHEKVVKTSESRKEVISDVRVRIEANEERQTVDRARLEALGERVSDVENTLAQDRLNMLRAEQLVDEAQRTLEHAQLSAIERAFPSLDESMRYIFAQLASEGICHACGQESSAAAERMRKGLEKRLCAICLQPLPAGPVVSAGELAMERIEHAKAKLRDAHQQFRAARQAYKETANNYTDLQKELVEVNSTIGHRHQELDSLYNQLPPEEAEIRRQKQSLNVFRGRIEDLRAQLAKAQRKYQDFVEKKTRELHGFAANLEEVFNGYAKGFLLEEISLSWAPVEQRLGVYAENPLILFPSFKLEVGGSDFSKPTQRDGPEKVSESQREFIDLAFRMALVRVAGMNGAGTLVIDAPESSLDVVFVGRAAKVLGQFALANAANRLIVTSNILSGELLPSLVKASSKGKVRPTVVDLFDLGVETAAIRQRRLQYNTVRRNLLRRITV